MVTGLAPASDAKVRTLLLRARGGVLPVELDLDTASALPAALRWKANGELQSWSWTHWHPAVAGAVDGGLALPDQIRIEESGVVSTMKFDGASLEAPAPAAAFARPTTRPDDTKFDPAVPSRLVGRRARSGHLIVKAALAGQAPALVFDSGAGTCVLARHCRGSASSVRRDAVGGGGRASRPATRAKALRSRSAVTIDHLSWSAN